MLDFFFFQAEDGIRDVAVTGVQTCALPISREAESTVAAMPRTTPWPSVSAPAPSPVDRVTASPAWIRAASAGDTLNTMSRAAGSATSISGWLGSAEAPRDRKSTRLNSSHGYISYAVFCLKKKKK